MPWILVDDAFHEHPKVVRLCIADVGLWTLCLTYSNRNRTDGRVASAAVARLGGPKWKKSAVALVAVGLWEEEGDCYIYHDYAKYQNTVERQAELAAIRAVRASNAAHARWNAGRMPDACPTHASSIGDAMHLQCTSDAETCPNPNPNPKEKSSSLSIPEVGAARLAPSANGKGLSPIAIDHAVTTYTAQGYTRSQVEEALGIAAHRIAEGKNIRNLSAYVGVILKQQAEEATASVVADERPREVSTAPAEVIAARRAERIAREKELRGE